MAGPRCWRRSNALFIFLSSRLLALRRAEDAIWFFPVLKRSGDFSVKKLDGLRALLAGFSGLLLSGLCFAEPVSVDSISQLPAIQNVSLSRDGDYMTALIAPPGEIDAEKMSIAVWDVTDMSKPPKIAAADKDSEFIGLSALKAGKILVIVRKPWTGRLGGCGEGKLTGATKTYLYKTFITDTNFSSFDDPFEAAIDSFRTGEFTQTCLEISGTAGVRSGLPLDDENILIERLDTRSFNTDILKYNLKTGKSEIVHRDVRGAAQADLLDPESQTVLTKTDITVGDGKYYFERWVLNEETGDYENHNPLLSTSDDRREVEFLGRDDASGKYYVKTDQFSDKDRIYMYDASKKAFDEEPIFSHPEYDAANVILGRTPADYNQLLGVSYLAGNIETEWLDEEFSGIVSAYETQLVGQSVDVIDYSADRSRILLRASSPSHPPSYFLLTDKISNMLIGSERPGLDSEALGKSELIYYPARDGLSIPAILTMPADWKVGDEAPPAIVMPHGGPWSRDFADWDFAGWVQFFSTRGLAVLQPQYRGSTGWGRELWLAGDAEWGSKMQDDKDDGARWMAEQGFADADNTVIYGYSYGGFAAFAATVRPDGPFKCAIGGAGVSDLNRLSNTWSSNRLQRVLQGRTVKGMDPIRNAEKADIPVLVIHGDRDVRVPISHGERFYKAVRKHVSAKFVEVKDMPHSMPWTPKMQRKTLAAVDDFLRQDCALPLK